mmetsp:Transcript_26311/g.84419  ORF Transcript_26311/g.84419 Transcript_26311/m.84419 type:complete len:101 (+) Transcript_26311:487-789(+)
MRRFGWTSQQTVPVPQAAVYDGSRAHAAFYKPHLDCKEPASNPRRLTAILYLQPPGWDGGGELRAHNELTLKYDVKWRKLHDSCWEVTSIGGLRAGDDLM